MKKTILIMITMFIFIGVAGWTNGEEASEMQEKEMETMDKDAIYIALILDAGNKSENAKNLFGALSHGLKRAGVEKQVVISFISTKDAMADADAIMKNNSVVVAINEGSEESFSDMQLAFIEANKSNPNFFAVALLPNTSTLETLKTLPEGIDVLASPSMKPTATKLIAHDLAKEIAAILKVTSKNPSVGF